MVFCGHDLLANPRASQIELWGGELVEPIAWKDFLLVNCGPWQKVGPGGSIVAF